MSKKIKTSFELKLDKELIKSITKSCSKNAVSSALNHLASVSKQQVPVDTGALRDSCTVSVNAEGTEGVVAYDTSYAVIQHENQTFNHQRGRKAKYLEDPCYDSGVQSEMVNLAQKAFQQEMG